jgi:HAD superfamily hydrolase (TIGR01509 family)
MPDAVIFDLDGLLLDSEQVWSAAKQRLVRERGGRWVNGAEETMLGMSSPEWSRYMREELRVPLEDDQIANEVVRIMRELYGQELPLLPGAADALARLAREWPLGMASSSNREVIDLVLDRTGWVELIQVSVASEEVTRGKPAPDVYLEASRRLGAQPERCVGIEDSGPGIRSACAAGLAVIAVPNPHYPPDETSLAQADLVLASLEELDPGAAESAEAKHREGSGSYG